MKGVSTSEKNEQSTYMQEYIYPFISLLAEMAPYLLFGFLVAGLLHVFVPKSFYAHYLAKNDFRSIALAALLGIPLPLCSCGVIPTAMSMRREGTSRAATVSFLIATPQTGVDSILATAALLGIPFAIMRPAAALVTALLSGALVMWANKKEQPIAQTCSITQPTEKKRTFGQKCLEALRYGYIDMIQDIGRWLVLGLLLAGLITILVPDGFFAQFSDKPLLNMLLVLIISAPMYLCATGSIPVAAALMLKGMLPGTALVLLMAGPATNMASMMVIGKSLGKKTLILYLVSIIIGAFAFGLLIDYVLPAEWFTSTLVADGACQHHMGLSWWKIASAILFTLLLLMAYILKYTNKTQTNMTTTFQVEGMMCNHCKANVEKNVAAIEGVQHVVADLTKGEVYVEGIADKAKVIEVITSLGYECHEA